MSLGPQVIPGGTGPALTLEHPGARTMGCDIHMTVESLDHDYETESRWRMVIGRDGAYGDRDYNVFSLLAGVRSDEDHSPKCIIPPRGLPTDLSPEAAKEMECADHTFSWLTLAELDTINWDMMFMERGTISAISYQRMMALGRPLHWSGGVWGGAIKHVSEDEMKALLKQHPYPEWAYRSEQWTQTWNAKTHPEMASHPLNEVYTQAEWPCSYRRACNGFRKWLKSLDSTRAGWGGNHTTTRLVFGFDN